MVFILSAIWIESSQLIYIGSARPGRRLMAPRKGADLCTQLGFGVAQAKPSRLFRLFKLEKRKLFECKPTEMINAGAIRACWTGIPAARPRAAPAHRKPSPRLDPGDKLAWQSADFALRNTRRPRFTLSGDAPRNSARHQWARRHLNWRPGSEP